MTKDTEYFNSESEFKEIVLNQMNRFIVEMSEDKKISMCKESYSITLSDGRPAVLEIWVRT